MVKIDLTIYVTIASEHIKDFQILTDSKESFFN